MPQRRRSGLLDVAGQDDVYTAGSVSGALTDRFRPWESITSPHAKALALAAIADIWIHGSDRMIDSAICYYRGIS